MTTLKLEVGKSYRTRDGERVDINAPYWGDNYFLGNSPHGATLIFSADGFCYAFPNHNLISEWQDEPTPVTYTQADTQPLVEALEAINKMAWEDNEWDAVRKYEKCKELADQALERFKGMNTLAEKTKMV